MPDKKWKTTITGDFDDIPYIRGYNITELIGNLTFSQAVFLVLKGELPNEKEAKMMDALLVSCIDHGIAPPSVVSARTIFSGGNSFNAAVAGGVMTMGDTHGGAIEQAAKIFQECIQNNISAKEVVKALKETKRRMPGYGHKIYTIDPRTTRMIEVAKELNLFGKYIKLALDIEKELELSTGKKLCLNVDGMVAAVISELGFDWKLGKGFFIISRCAGLVAHVHEEWCKEKPFRRLGNEEYEYIGVKPRKLPKNSMCIAPSGVHQDTIALH